MVLGKQNSDKSTLLNRIIQIKILREATIKETNTFWRLQFTHANEYSIQIIRPNKLELLQFESFNQLQKYVKEMKLEDDIEEIKLKIHKENQIDKVQDYDIVDLPGLEDGNHSVLIRKYREEN